MSEKNFYRQVKFQGNLLSLKLKNNKLFFIDQNSGKIFLTISNFEKILLKEIDNFIIFLDENNFSLTIKSWNIFLKDGKINFYSNHFYGDLLSQFKTLEEKLSEQSNEIFLYSKVEYEKLKKNFNQDTRKDDLKNFRLESITDDIYGTTTMEGENIEKEFIKKDFKKSDKLNEQEAINIKNAFQYIEGIDFNGILREELIKEIHIIATKNLDNLKTKNDGLDYHSGDFRTEIVDMGIFQNQKEKYLPPNNVEQYLNELIKKYNNGNFNLIKLALFHILFYGLHPFSNGNKRTTRILESLFIQNNIDKGHYFKGMGYFFKRKIDTYFKNIRNTLSGKKSLENWCIYYIQSFKDMVDYSIYEYENLKKDVFEKIPKNRHRYYNQKDQIFYNFYLKNKDKKFKTKELFLYLKEKGINYSEPKQVNKIMQKHIKDCIIEKIDNIYYSYK